MPYSQQSYQGQGIVTQNVAPRGGEIIGAALADAGRSISQGVMDYKRRSGASKGMRMTLEQLGLLSKEEAESMGFAELLEYSKNTPALLQQMTQEQEQGFMRDAFAASQPQMVEDQLVSNQMIEAARMRRDQAETDYNMSLPPVGSFPQEPEPSTSFLQQIAPQRVAQGGNYRADRMPAMSMEDRTVPSEIKTPELVVQAMEEKQAMLASGRGRKSAPPTNAPQPQQTAPAQPQVAQEPQTNPLLDKLNAAQQELDLLEIRQREGDSTIRQETADETNQRFSSALADLVQKYPKASKLAFDMVFKDKQTMTPSDQLAYQKYQDEFKARTIPGVGVAPSVETAKELRSLHTAFQKVDGGVNRLLQILNTPNRTITPELRKEANTIKALLTGALRVPIVGPGAFTDPERKLIDSVIADPTAIFSIDANTRASLTTLRNRIKDDRDIYAESIGIGSIGDSGNEPTWDGTKFR